jgi:hypothetical protein
MRACVCFVALAEENRSKLKCCAVCNRPWGRDIFGAGTLVGVVEGTAGRSKFEARVRSARVATSARFNGSPPSIWWGPEVALLGRWLGINVGLLNVGGMSPGCGSLARAARADPSHLWSIVRVLTGWCGERSWRV